MPGLTISEPQPCYMPLTPDNTCTREELFVCNSNKTARSDIVRDEGYLTAGYVRVACEFDGFQTGPEITVIIIIVGVRLLGSRDIWTIAMQEQ